ncbi:MAG TPA: PLP-dependent aminotransferase family protein [Rhizomicrobium sp.]|jgi:DNA-binding transcriptional MocR family regulator
MVWTPTISDGEGPLYRRIADALAGDIAEGRLRRGQQLPTHRALAQTLGIDLSTVTHAYREARARGLIDAHVGRGTFVVETLAQARGPDRGWAQFDLSMNLPPQPLDADLEGRIAHGIVALTREQGLSGYLNYREPGGVAAEREAAAAWLKQRIPQADAARLLVCPGTQSVLSLLVSTLASPGDTILTEALTYPGMKAVAQRAQVKLVGVSTDASGILPDALREAVRRYRPKALYLIPTQHNPTTVTMPPVRRRQVVEILRARGLALVEDDAYGALEPEALCFARLMPELTWHAASVSKCMAPGLRVSFVLAPSAVLAAQLAEALRAMVQMSAPLMAGLVARWISDGSAAAIVAAIRAEAGARQKLAAKLLAGRSYAAQPHSHHLWLPLPARAAPAEFVAQARQRGVAIVGSDAFAVGLDAPNAVRVALGAAASRAELVAALKVLVAVLDSPARAAAIV